MSNYLLGVDPGKTTGMCLLDTSNPMNPVVLWSGEFNVKDFYQKAEETVEAHYMEGLEIVCENFIITQATAKKGQAPWSLRGCGVMEFLSMKFNCPFTLQKPVDAKNFSTNAKLRLAGFWHVGGEGHANDALRHCMLYLVTKNQKWAKNLIV